MHEMGHAVAGLILFKGQISIYVGSYGDPKKGVHFRIGRLKVHFKYNPLMWNHGLCVSDCSHRSFIQGYLFTLAGPVASLMIAVTCVFLLINHESHGILKMISAFLLLSSISDFFRNISANKNPIFLHDGTLTYNDGQNLKMLREYRHVYTEITLLNQHYTNNEIEKGITLFEKIYSMNQDPNILRMGIALNIKDENYIRAIALVEEFGHESELNSDDYCNYAFAHSHCGEHIKALEFYNKSLELNPSAFYALNNRGYTLNVLERYEEAITDFNKAVELNPNFAYAYSNRGLSQIKLGDVKEGLSDIEKSLDLDNQNSYAYKNLGIYHKDKGDVSEAKKFFQQAKACDPKTEGLNRLISETEIEMKNT